MFMFDSGSSSDLGAVMWSGALRVDLEEIWAHWCLSEVFSIFKTHCVWIMMPPLCHQIITALEEDSTAQKMQLGYRLQQIAAAVENKVTDLWWSEQDYWEQAASPELNSCSWTTGRSWWTERRQQNSHLQIKCVEEEDFQYFSASICLCCCCLSPLAWRFTHVRFVLTAVLQVWILSERSTNSHKVFCSSSCLQNLSSLFQKWS